MSGQNEQAHQDEEHELSPHNVVDKVAFGRRLRAQRILAGFDRVTDFVALLRSQYGVDISDRSVYAIERGEQMPHLDLVVASVALLKSPVDYFAPAIRPDVIEALWGKS